MMLVAVGTAAQAESAVAELARLIPEPFLTVERIRVCKRDGQLFARPHAFPAADADGLHLFQKLTVFTDEDARHDGQPIHRALVRRLRESHHASGATALRGLWGFHGDRPPHGDKMFRLGRSVPVTTSSSTPRMPSRPASTSSTNSPPSTVWSPARWCPPCWPSTAGIDGAAPGWRGTDTDRVSLALAYLAVYRPTPWSRLVRPR